MVVAARRCGCQGRPRDRVVRMTESPGPSTFDGELRRELVRELDRVTDRLRSLSLDRLQRPDAEGRAPEQRAREVAQALADLAADATGRPHRPLPVLRPHGVADQVAVTGADVLAEAGPASQRQALDVLTALRRTL
jgi:hypothetical protein